jgi:hypothetical protein
MTPTQPYFYELIYHPQSRFFLQKFKEGPGARLFMNVVNMSLPVARDEAVRLGEALDSFCRNIYYVEIKARRFVKSYDSFILQPEVTALRLIYILNTLSATYPQHYSKFFAAIAACILGGTTEPNQRSNPFNCGDARFSEQLKSREVSK